VAQESLGVQMKAVSARRQGGNSPCREQPHHGVRGGARHTLLTVLTVAVPARLRRRQNQRPQGAQSAAAYRILRGLPIIRRAPRDVKTLGCWRCCLVAEQGVALVLFRRHL